MASSSSFRDIENNYFVTVSAEAADIGDSTKRKRIRVSLKKNPQIVGLRSPMCNTIVLAGRHNLARNWGFGAGFKFKVAANNRNHDFKTLIDSKCCFICHRLAVI